MTSSRALRIQSAAIPQVMGQPALVPVRLSGQEGVNSLFEYELLVQTPEELQLSSVGRAADFNLDDFLGWEISCFVELDGSGTFTPGGIGAPAGRVGAGTREINALIASAQFWGEEGRQLQYKLTLRPWLHLATLSTDCKVFQNQTVVQILDELLADYPFAVDKRLIERYPLRDYQVQYNESDFAFFERLCQEWGISYHFEHDEGKHRLVLADNLGAYRPNPSAAYQSVPYHPPGHKPDAEYLHSWAPAHHLTSGRYRSTDYDYTQPRADLAQRRTDPRPTGHADAEVYQWQAETGGAHWAQPRAGNGSDASRGGTAEEGRLLALLRMQQLRTAGARAQASGNLRAMVPGCTFHLSEHPRQSAKGEYLILDTRLLIEDVGQSSQIGQAGAGRGQQWRVQVDLTAHPSAEPLRPAFTRAKPHTHGPQTALVVGPEGQELWTDELGRIKVQFPWDRIGAKDQHSSCWVRVGSPWAGNQLGGVHVPRIGQEVIVDFVGGDPDLPLCTGRVHNQVNLPPWRLPGQSALSGFRSRELTEGGGNGAGGRSNHLVMDDTAGQIQVQLQSDHQHSSLSLGSITRIEGNDGRKEARGDGAELRTDGHLAMRGGAGMLVSTDGRPKAEEHAKALQETAQRLGLAQQRHETLANLAHQCDAQDGQDQASVALAIDEDRQAIRGHGQVDASSGQFPEFSKPHLVLSSPEGIHASAQQSVHLASGEHTAITSGGHTSIASHKSLLASARDAVRLFAYKMGMRLVAASGDIDIRALKHNINLLAQLDIHQSAERITISARKELQIQGGGSYSRYSASGIESGTPGNWVCHANARSFVGPKSVQMAASEWPDARFNEQFVLRDNNDQPLVDMRWRLKREDGSTLEGVTGSTGAIVLEKGLDPARVAIELLGPAAR